MLLTLLSNRITVETQLYPITPLDLQDDLALADDALAQLTPTLNVHIASMVAVLEHLLNRKLMTQTVVRKFDCLSGELNLSVSPVQSISSITYLDCDGVRQVLPSDQYILDDYKQPAQVLPALGISWPSTYSKENNVEVSFVAGYGDHNAVPDAAKLWLRAAVKKVMTDCDGNGALPHNFMGALIQSLKVYC